MAMVRPEPDRRTAAASPAMPAPMMCTVPASDEGMPQCDPNEMRFVDVNAIARPRPAARHHGREHLAIDLAHDLGRPHHAMRAARHDPVGLGEMVARAVGEKAAGDADPWMRNRRLWIGG